MKRSTLHSYFTHENLPTGRLARINLKIVQVYVVGEKPEPTRFARFHSCRIINTAAIVGFQESLLKVNRHELHEIGNIQSDIILSILGFINFFACTPCERLTAEPMSSRYRSMNIHSSIMNAVCSNHYSSTEAVSHEDSLCPNHHSIPVAVKQYSLIISAAAAVRE